MGELNKDPYLITRVPISTNVDHAHLLEVGGICPLCGKNLLAAKGSGRSKLYQIAHIYPNSPLDEQKKELDGLERLGITCEDFENKIALCKDCHGIYDDHVTKEEYTRLLEIKKRLLREANAKVAASYQDLDDELILLINKLGSFNGNSGEVVPLSYDALNISDKIENKYFILKQKIELYVCIYYNFIKEQAKLLQSADKLNFDIIAYQVKISFLKCESKMEDKSDIFYTLVNWMQSKITGVSVESCEVMVAFFVQNCEVFREITK